MNRYTIFEATGDRADKLKADHKHIAALNDAVMSLHQTFQEGPRDDDLKTRPGTGDVLRALDGRPKPHGRPRHGRRNDDMADELGHRDHRR